MRSGAAGGYAGTIVLDPPDVLRTARLLADAANMLGTLSRRLGSRPFPDMPADVAGRVRLEVSEVCCLLGSEPGLLVEEARELRARALWAQIADRLSGGTDLEGAQLAAFKVTIADGSLLRYAEPWQADLARAYAEELHDREHPGGFGGFLHSVGGGIADFATGAWDSVKDPAVMLYHLTPLNSGWTQEWTALGHGLEYGATHPLEFGKAVIALDALEQRGFAYWLGNLAPAAAAAFFTGGGAAAVRGGRVVSTTVRTSEDVARFATLTGRAAYTGEAGERIAYGGFARAIDSFVGREAVLHEGPTSGRALVNFFNSERTVESGQRSVGWWANFDEARGWRTEEGMRDAAAIPQHWDLTPDGRALPRDGVGIAYVPEGAPTTHLEGHALRQFDEVTGAYRPGGAYQEAYRDFDPRWIAGHTTSEDFFAGQARLSAHMPAHFHPGRASVGAAVVRGADAAAASR
jgi:hypothetical protein